MPAWTDERAHEMMRESRWAAMAQRVAGGQQAADGGGVGRFLRRHIVLEKGDHSYRSGAQHKVLQQYHDAGFRCLPRPRVQLPMPIHP